MPTLQELGQAHEGALHKYEEKYVSFPKKKLADGAEAPDIPAEGLKELDGLMTEVEATGEAYRAARKADDRHQKALAERTALDGVPRGGAPAPAKGQEDAFEHKSLGELFTGTKAFEGKRFDRSKKDVEFSLDVDVKTLMATSAGLAPETTRSGRTVLSGQRKPRLLDVIPGGTITQPANVYMRETVYTNNAAETAEGGQMPEVALAYAEINEPVQKIAAYIPVTDEQLEDVPNVRSLVDNRLTLMLRQRLELQIMQGNGTSPNLRGFLNAAGIQTQARGTDPAFDAWLKLYVKLMDTPGFVDPTALVMNPVDWQNLLLTRTADGQYILGNPGSALNQTLWGMPIVASSVMTAGTGVMGDFEGYAEVLIYRGVDIAITNSNNDDFVKGRQCIRGTLRAVNTLYRNNAVGTVTGLAPTP